MFSFEQHVGQLFAGGNALGFFAELVGLIGEGSQQGGGFIVFATAGVIYWKIGLMMGVAQFLGARVGASLAMRIGARLIKPLLVIVCLALAVKLLADPANPLRVMIGV